MGSIMQLEALKKCIVIKILSLLFEDGGRLGVQRNIQRIREMVNSTPSYFAITKITHFYVFPFLV